MLIELKTKLKSLKFGQTDKPGGKALNNEEKEPGRFAQQPYIRKEIPDADGSFVDGNGDPILYSGPGILGTGGPDIIIRGGALSVTRSVKDVSRLTQMFADTTNGARGIQYTVKENILSKTSVRTEASKGPLNQGAYLPTSTIAQAGVNAFGGHLNHLGIDPTGLTILGVQKYENVFHSDGITGEKDQLISFNRLYKLHQGQLEAKGSGDSSLLGKIGSAISNTFGGIDYFPNKTTILQYGGGPSSVGGIGQTSIKTAEYTIGKRFNGFVENKFQFTPGDVNGVNITTNPQSRFTNVGAPNSETSLIVNDGIIDYSKLNPSDFRRNLKEYKELKNSPTPSSKVLSLSPDYNNSKKNIHGRVNLGDPGKRNTKDNKNIWNYSADNLEALDTITSSDTILVSGPSESSINDLVQFRIADVWNSKGDGTAVYMHFRAFLDSFNDAYNATWNPVNYVGRGDTLYNYGNFNRTINVSFTVAAQSKPELMPMYKKLNHLASTLAPDYSTGGFMRGNITRLTVGSYIREQHGFISSLTYDVPQESPWEIAIDSKGDGGPNREDAGQTKELPHVIKVSMTFTPIHNFLPQKVQSHGNPKQKYILGNGLSKKK